MTVSRQLLEEIKQVIDGLMPGAKYVSDMDFKLLNETSLAVNRAIANYNADLDVEHKYLRDALHYFGWSAPESDEELGARMPSLMRRVVRAAAYAKEGGAQDPLSEQSQARLAQEEINDIPGNHAGLCQPCVQKLGLALAKKCPASRPDPQFCNQKDKR